MADEESEIDQQVYDELIAAGKSERIARAKAKAAAVRARKPEQPEQQADGGEAEQPAAGRADQPAGSHAADTGGGTVATGDETEPSATQGVAMTPEQRQARVQAALAQKGGRSQAPARHQEQEQTHRLLAMVPPTGIQQIRSKQEDKVYTWPHLISQEFLALMAVTAFLLVAATTIAAPLEDLANPNVTPDPSKAPWYFLGLQEQLAYFHPMIAGVTIPGVALGLLAATPFLDKNPSVRPENRKTAMVAFTFFLVFWGVLVMSGSFFRGPGFNWVWPWVDGLWFTL